MLPGCWPVEDTIPAFFVVLSLIRPPARPVGTPTIEIESVSVFSYYGITQDADAGDLYVDRVTRRYRSYAGRSPAIDYVTG